MTEITPEHCEAQQRRWAEEDRDVWHELAVLESRIEALEKENRALRANASKSVLRRLEDQGALAAEEKP